MADRETELMLSVKGGSREAFEELYRSFRKPLAGYFYRLCWSRAKVDDLLQETFLRIWKAAPRYEPRARVSTWIFRIAHNLWINHASRRGEDRLDRADPPVDRPPETGLEREELRDAVRKAVEELPERERETLLLAEYGGFPYAQIAEILEIPVGTVKSRIFNAIRRLRDSLKDLPRT